MIPFSFQDYVTAIQAKRVCIVDPNANQFDKIFGLASLVISGINYNDWPVPFVFCNSYACKDRGEDATNYCTYKTLAISTMNGSAEEMERMERFKDYVETRYPQITNTNLPFDYDFIQTFDNNDKLTSYVSSDTYGEFVNGKYRPKIAIAVVFDGADDDKSYDYTIRTNSTNFNSEELSAQPAAKTTPNTNRVFDPYKREDSNSCSTSGGAPGPDSCTKQYILNGAITIQRLVDDWILSDSGVEVTVAQNSAVFLPFPTKEYTKSGFYQTIAPFAPLLFTLGLLYPVSSTIRSIVLEKELRQKELMKMMGVTEAELGWGWFTSFYLFFCPCGILTAVFTNLLYAQSSFGWLLLFWQLTFISCIVYCFVISSISTKATRATLIGIMLFFVGYFLPFIVDYQDGSSAVITLLSLHPVTAYTYGLNMMGYLEDSGVGVQTTSIFASEFPSGYTFGSSLSMLLFDSILWGIVSWYLNRTLQGDYGTALRWYFPFTRQYWCPSYKAVDVEPPVDASSVDNSAIPIESIRVVQNPSDTLDIRGLSKTFGDKTAVDSLTLSMYSNQITCLLGHNGAGKTTTIGMLTGMVPPTSGSAKVGGYDVGTDMRHIRSNVGVCLQHDCLFPQLTVEEHIVFFSKVKGLYSTKSKEECKESIMASIKDVALLEKQHNFAKDLSGGMKRKLSVAIAFCGESKVIFLDEPTSGMDPFARRFTWNVIRQYRENRIIVLTTHFMDEADLLGDRIAIMAAGKLRCCGSSLFLKKQYGVGYQLTIVKSNKNVSTKLKEDIGNDEVVKSKSDVVDTTPLVEGEKRKGDDKQNTPIDDDQWVTVADVPLVKAGEKGKEDENKQSIGETKECGDLDDTLKKIVSYVPSSKVLSNVGTELSFQLPIGESARFIAMFEQLDKLIEDKKIESYGVSVTTLDEVFLMVARGEEGVHQSTIKEAAPVKDDKESNPDRALLDTTDSGSIRFKRHVSALFMKRAKNFKRDKKAWCCSTILPTVTTLAGFLIFNLIARRNPNYPSLTLSLDQNNPEIVSLRNPIPYNDPGVYDCQPGQCSYGSSTVNITETNEVYYFCGANAQVDNPSSNTSESATTCTIANSTSIMNQVVQFGAFGVENDVSSVLNSSKGVYDSSYDFAASQYGSIFFTHDTASVISNDGASFDETVVKQCMENTGDYTTEEQCLDFGGIGYIVNYNYTSLHSSLLYQSTADEALLREYTNDPEYKISASVWPLPLTKVEEQYTLASNAFAAWFLLVLSFPFIAGSFATFIVAERESKAKHLQTVAGVQPSAYWLSTYSWDVMNYQIPLWVVVALMYALDVESFITTDKGASSTTLALLILFGPASAGFTYILSFKFKSPSMANLFIIVFNFFIGMAGKVRYTINIVFFQTLESQTLTTWSPEIALYEVIFLGMESIVYIFITIQIDILSTKPRTLIVLKKVKDCLTLKWIFGKKTHTADDEVTEAESVDEDVIAENERVDSGGADDDLIVLHNLSKVYPNGKRAVDHVSLGIPPGQCFGLLGINGAGKTTTMSILTAEFPPSGGDAFLAGFSVSNQPEQTRKRIGYCPQFDAHFACMTGFEHVALYAVIKGVKKDILKEVVSAKLEEVGLSESDGNRLSSGYSGGMKRKLSVACATIGSPSIAFLDEPSTGMDPVSRRDLWKVIGKIVQGGTSVVLTTHSMEECEALCSRISIMAGGRLRCLGSAQHLKNRFGQGYQIEMKVRHPTNEDRDVLDTTRQSLECLELPLGEDTVDLFRLAGNTCINLEQGKQVCEALTDDDYLSKMVDVDNPKGYHIYNLAQSQVGVALDEFIAFCVEELRVKAVVDFFEKSYQSATLRERQDVKVRFEICSDGVSISSVFANLENHKDELYMEDYGVSQTSLEQVFNGFASVAESEKENE